MKCGFLATLTIWPAVGAMAATAYVTDELVLGVYAEQNTQGPRLATLHSGASVETLAVSGESTQVQLPDGKIGWVKTSYLTTREPAVARLKQLQDELNLSRATARPPPEPANSTPLDTAQSADTAASAPASATAPIANIVTSDPSGGPLQLQIGLWLVTVCAALGGGFWLGYASLARRIRKKFGGLKVY